MASQLCNLYSYDLFWISLSVCQFQRAQYIWPSQNIINNDISAEKYTATLTVITIIEFHYYIFNVQSTEIRKENVISKLYLHQISYKLASIPRSCSLFEPTNTDLDKYLWAQSKRSCF